MTDGAELRVEMIDALQSGVGEFAHGNFAGMHERGLSVRIAQAERERVAQRQWRE